MDWFEHLTGLSPDGGSGLYEIGLIVLAALSAIVATGLALRRLSSGRRERNRG